MTEQPTHEGPDPSHGGLTTHRGTRENCSGPDCGPTDEQRLHHLLDRARRGALLPAEGEQLAGLVGELEKSAAINEEVDARADEQLNSCTEVAQYYKALAERTQTWGEQHRDRANRYRARTEAVRAELNAMRRDMGGSEDDGMSTAVSRIRAALQSVSHETPVPDDPRVTELEAERDRYRTAWKSARQRAEAHTEGIYRLCGDRDAYKGWLEQEQAHSAGLRAEVARLTAGQQPAGPVLPGDQRTCCDARIGHYPGCPANQPSATA